MAPQQPVAQAGPLAAFLRARRDQTRPEQVELVAGPERQVPGLRRDEVAMLAGISTDYYVRLEQGRERHPSRQVVDGLALALALDGAGVRYVTDLAEADRLSTHPGEVATTRLSALTDLVDGWTSTPALIVDRWLDVVVANHLGAALHEGLVHGGNYARMVFLAPGARSFFLDWQRVADCAVGSLRASAGAETEAPRLTALVGELSLKSADFAASWVRQDLHEKASDRKRLLHPLVGALVLDQHVLDLPGGDPVVPLYAFIFLVVLGIDYSIFLMTRVREESVVHGTRAGTLIGLRTTGGVITSAGVVLAATFAALSVVPLLFLVQIAFIVTVGILLDTIVVRSLVVPGLVHDIGDRTWWPSSLWRRRGASLVTSGTLAASLERDAAMR